MSTQTTQWENVKLKKEVVDMLRSHKEETGIPITVFLERIILREIKPLPAKKKK
jgi:hypothetical protein